MALIGINIKKLHLGHDEKEYLLMRSMENSKCPSKACNKFEGIANHGQMLL
jgi:hypothetical protein